MHKRALKRYTISHEYYASQTKPAIFFSASYGERHDWTYNNFKCFTKSHQQLLPNAC